MTFCVVVKYDGRATIAMIVNLDLEFDEVVRSEVVR